MAIFHTSVVIEFEAPSVEAAAKRVLDALYTKELSDIEIIHLDVKEGQMPEAEVAA